MFTFSNIRPAKSALRKPTLVFILIVIMSIVSHGQSPIQLDWSLLFGGNAPNNRRIEDIAVDSKGYVYGVGSAANVISTTNGAYDEAYNGGTYDVFVFKAKDDGSSIVWVTYLGGNSTDEGTGIVVNNNDEVFITGVTRSSNFPTTSNAYDNTLGVKDAFVAMLSADGSQLLYSTLVGGSGIDVAMDIAIDANSDPVITGTTTSTDFPNNGTELDVTYNGQQSPGSQQGDAFVFKLKNNGQAMDYGSYLGGSLNEQGVAIAIDASNDVYIAGYTDSDDFPTVSSSLDTSYNGNGDAFLLKLTNGATALSYSTFLGGTLYEGDGQMEAMDMIIDPNGEAFVTGSSASADFPITTGAYDTQLNTSNLHDVFVLKMNQTGDTLRYSTFLGGESNDWGTGIALSDSGDVFVTGMTSSPDFPMSKCSTDSSHNSDPSTNADVFVTTILNEGTTLKYSSFFGGKLTEGNPKIQLPNKTCPMHAIVSIHNNSSNDYNHNLLGLKAILNGGFEVNTSCGLSVEFNDTSGCYFNDRKRVWDFGDGTNSSEKEPIHIYADTGMYTVSLHISCPAETISSLVHVRSSAGQFDLGEDTTACSGGSVVLDATTPTASYLWQDSSTDPTHVVSTPGKYWVQVTANGCISSDTINVSFQDLISISVQDSTLAGCDRQGSSGGSVTVTATEGSSPYSYSWNSDPVQDSSTAVGLAPGIYEVTAIDALGCRAMLEVKVEAKIELDSVLVHPSCDQCTDGSAAIVVSGGTGTPPFTYRWDDANEQTTAIASGLAAGTYTVTVTDSAGCFRQMTVILGSVGFEEETYEVNLDIYPNPTSGSLVIDADLEGEWKLVILDLYGRTVYKGNELFLPLQLDLDKVLAKGIYNLYIFNERYSTSKRFVFR